MSSAPRVEPIVLQEPQCEVGCRTCLLECAVMPERLAWWLGEIERLYRERALAADRRLYEPPLQIAEAASAALARRMADSPLRIGQHLREFGFTRQRVRRDRGRGAVAGEQRGQAEPGGARKCLDRVDARHRAFPEITPEAGIDPGIEAPAPVRQRLAGVVMRAGRFEQGDDVGGGRVGHVRRIAHR
jgi:hypothetical protein